MVSRALARDPLGTPASCKFPICFPSGPVVPQCLSSGPTFYGLFFCLFCFPFPLLCFCLDISIRVTKKAGVGQVFASVLTLHLGVAVWSKVSMSRAQGSSLGDAMARGRDSQSGAGSRNVCVAFGFLSCDTQCSRLAACCEQRQLHSIISLGVTWQGLKTNHAPA